jgi:NitT/TauT family transport system substrate-binding protein
MMTRLAGIALTLLLLACSGPSAAPPAPAAPAATSGTASGAAPQPAPAPTAAPAALLPVKVAIPDLSIVTLPLAAGIAKGIFREEGLDVELVQIGGQAALPALLNGEVGYLYGWGATSSGIVQGAPIKILAIIQDRPPHVVVVKPDVRTAADLRGKRGAISRSGGTDDQVIQRVLQSAGLRGDDVEMARLGETSLRFTALVAGQIDFTALAQPFTAEAQKQGFHVLARGGDLYQVPISIVATSEAHLAAAPDEVRRYVRGVARTLVYATDPANLPEIVPFAAERYAVEPGLVDAMVDETLGIVVPTGEAPEAVLDAALDVARSTVDRPAPVTRATVFDFSLLRAARRDLNLP